MRVYIAGPMTGQPRCNESAFDAARDAWMAAGWEVVSPMDLTREFWRREFGEEFDPASPDPRIWAGGDLYERFLAEDLAAIATCDAIALLPGWEHSRGVARERVVAEQHGLPEYDALTFTLREAA